MVANLLMRGMLAGVAAGLLAFCFAHTFGEPQVDLAIGVEKMHAEQAAQHEEQIIAIENANLPAGAKHHEMPAEEPELVSRAVQSSIGLLAGSIVYSAGIGGLFALVFAFTQGRLGNFDPRTTAALLAVMGYVAIILVPGIKYPPNPPSIGNPDTIGIRTELYFVLILTSLVAVTFCVTVARSLASRLGGWNASIAAGLLFIVLIPIAQNSLPDINEVSADFPATVLWQFRTASWGMQFIIWASIGLIFGMMAERSLGVNLKRVGAAA